MKDSTMLILGIVILVLFLKDQHCEHVTQDRCTLGFANPVK